MSERHKGGVTVSFVITEAHNETITTLALAIGQARGRVVSRSTALRHIINVYTRLDETLRRAAIVANHEA